MNKPGSIEKYEKPIFSGSEFDLITHQLIKLHRDIDLNNPCKLVQKCCLEADKVEK